MKLFDLFESPVLYPIVNAFLPTAENQARAIIACRPRSLSDRLKEFRGVLDRLEEWLTDLHMQAVQEEELYEMVRQQFRSPSRGSDSS